MEVHPQPPLEEHGRDDSSPEAVLAFCRQLHRTLKTIGLYGRDHPAAASIHRDLYQLYRQATDDRESVLLAFGPDQLIINEERIDGLSHALRSLCDHMRRLGIARIILSEGAEQEEVQELLAYLVALPTAGAETDQPSALDGHGFSHFRLAGLDCNVTIANDGIRLSADPNLTERERQLWYALITGRGGASVEPLTREAMEFLRELLHREGSLAHLVQQVKTQGGGDGGSQPVLPGKLLAQLFNRIVHSAAQLPAHERGDFLRDLGARTLELTPDDLIDLLAGGEVDGDLLAQSLQANTEEKLLDTMAALLRVEGADSLRLAHCVGAFMRPESAAERVLPAVRQRVHQSAEHNDGEALTVWQRVEALALDSLGQRYMSNAYEGQLDDFASDYFPTLSEYKTVQTVSEEDLATLAPAFLAQGHTQLLLDLLADETELNEFRRVIEALIERLVAAIDASNYELATLIATDLRRQCSRESDRSKEFKQVIWTHLGGLDLGAITDRAFTEIESMKAQYFDEFNTFLKVFQGAITPHLLDRLEREEDRAVRRSLLRILASFTDELIPELLARLDSEHWYYVRNIVHLLGQSGSPDAVRPLTLQLQHKDPRVRREALLALANLASPRCIPFVARVLTDDTVAVSPDHDQVRVEAARCLARFPQEAAVTALRKGLLSKRPMVADACRRILSEKQ
jgi:hypothetical protein